METMQHCGSEEDRAVYADGSNVRVAFLMAVVAPAGLGVPLMMAVGLFGVGMSPGMALLLVANLGVRSCPVRQGMT